MNADEKQRLLETFDAIAPEYETYRLSPWYKAHAEEILRHIAPKERDVILDIGCGTGWLLRQLKRQHPGVQGIGIDVSPGMLAAAKNHTQAEQLVDMRFIQGDWDTIDPKAVPTEAVTTIICANAFHYFADPQAATARMYAALSPGGKIFLLERDKTGSLLTKIWGVLHRLFIRHHVRFYRTDDLTHFLSTAGFKNVRVVARIKKYFWKKKLYTHVVLLTGEKV